MLKPMLRHPIGAGNHKVELLQVAEEIQKAGQLLRAVLECHGVGRRASAFEWTVTLAVNQQALIA